MRRIWWLAVLLVATARPAHADTDESIFGLVVHGEYGLGRNFSPQGGDISRAYVSTVLVDAGIGMIDPVNGDGFILAAEGAAMIGHSIGTDDDLLLGGVVRFAHAGAYAKLGPEFGLEGTKLGVLQAGFALPVGLFAPSLGVGLAVGEMQHDDFVAIITISLGVDRYFPVGHSSKR